MSAVLDHAGVKRRKKSEEVDGTARLRAEIDDLREGRMVLTAAERRMKVHEYSQRLWGATKFAVRSPDHPPHHLDQVEIILGQDVIALSAEHLNRKYTPQKTTAFQALVDFHIWPSSVVRIVGRDERDDFYRALKAMVDDMRVEIDLGDFVDKNNWWLVYGCMLANPQRRARLKQEEISEKLDTFFKFGHQNCGDHVTRELCRAAIDQGVLDITSLVDQMENFDASKIQILEWCIQLEQRRVGKSQQQSLALARAFVQSSSVPAAVAHVHLLPFLWLGTQIAEPPFVHSKVEKLNAIPPHEMEAIQQKRLRSLKSLQAMLKDHGAYDPSMVDPKELE